MRIFLFLVGMMVAGLSNAPRANADDGREVWTCLEQIVTLDEFRTQCIGTVTKLCQTDPQMQNSRGLVACYGREALAWDGALNGIYKELRNLLPEAEHAPLKAAQLGWIKDRDATCAMEGIIANRYSGSASAEAQARCKRDMTAERVVRLWYWRNVLKDG